MDEKKQVKWKRLRRRVDKQTMIAVLFGKSDKNGIKPHSSVE